MFLSLLDISTTLNCSTIISLCVYFPLPPASSISIYFMSLPLVPFSLHRFILIFCPSRFLHFLICSSFLSAYLFSSLSVTLFMGDSETSCPIVVSRLSRHYHVLKRHTLSFRSTASPSPPRLKRYLYFLYPAVNTRLGYASEALFNHTLEWRHMLYTVLETRVCEHVNILLTHLTFFCVWKTYIHGIKPPVTNSHNHNLKHVWPIIIKPSVRLFQTAVNAMLYWNII